MLKLSDKDFKTYFKMLQATNANIPEVSENRKCLQRKQKIYKKELNGNFRTEKQNNHKRKSYWTHLIM